MTMDDSKTNQVVVLPVGAVPGVAPLPGSIRMFSGPWYKTIDLVSVFHLLPHQKERSEFIFAWNRQKYTITVLPQGCYLPSHHLTSAWARRAMNKHIGSLDETHALQRVEENAMKIQRPDISMKFLGTSRLGYARDIPSKVKDAVIVCPSQPPLGFGGSIFHTWEFCSIPFTR